MSVERVVLNHAQVGAFLHSGEVEVMVRRHAAQIAARAGAGYAADTWQGRTRVVASAFTETPKAMRDNAKRNTLLRELRSQK
ncbi:hypothetical protein ABZS16_04260 [Trueperella pyogenes]|uniref:hypothetical protein n=1 Tax=Trueperella pyogenes TaxID=1661 RepID=UPI00339D690C